MWKRKHSGKSSIHLLFMLTHYSHYMHDSNVFAYIQWFDCIKLFTIFGSFKWKYWAKLVNLFSQMCNGSTFMLAHEIVFGFRRYMGLIISLVILLVRETNDPTFMKSGFVSSKINNRKISLAENNIGSNPKWRRTKNRIPNTTITFSLGYSLCVWPNKRTDILHLNDIGFTPIYRKCDVFVAHLYRQLSSRM